MTLLLNRLLIFGGFLLSEWIDVYFLHDSNAAVFSSAARNAPLSRRWNDVDGRSADRGSASFIARMHNLSATDEHFFHSFQSLTSTVRSAEADNSDAASVGGFEVTTKDAAVQSVEVFQSNLYKDGGYVRWGICESKSAERSAGTSRLSENRSVLHRFRARLLQPLLEWSVKWTTNEQILCSSRILDSDYFIKQLCFRTINVQLNRWFWWEELWASIKEEGRYDLLILIINYSCLWWIYV